MSATANSPGARSTADARHAGTFPSRRYDFTCETVESRLAEPMRGACPDLTEMVVDSGHWMAQEKPVEVNAALVRWLADKFPELWRK